MTEAASMITANPLDGPRKRVGRRPRAAVLGCTAAGAAAAGEIGRVLIRGGGRDTTYDTGGRPGATDAGAGCDTGDLGYLDADGYLYLAGRSDDVINRGGEKIYPREIEGILLAQPGVSPRPSSPRTTRSSGNDRSPTWCPTGDFVAEEIEAALARGPARRGCHGTSSQARTAWSRRCRSARPGRSPVGC